MPLSVMSRDADAGDAARIVGDCGEMVAVGDADGLGSATITLLDLDDDARAVWSRRARARVETEFSLPVALDRYAALYRDVLNWPIGD